jgi:Zn finger protein HypA/HybF involved in hydrogenase expression
MSRKQDTLIESQPPPEIDAEALMRTCPNCSAELDERQCKLICPRCHYYMSCSDYY